LPTALFVITARAPIDRIFNWPFIGAFIGGALLTLLIAVTVGRFWFHHRDVSTLSMVGLTAGWGNVGYMGLPLLLTAYGPDGALPMTEKTTNAAWRTKPSFYAVSTQDRTINPDLERFMAKRMGAKTIEIEASHLALISQPDAITNLIMEALAV